MSLLRTPLNKLMILAFIVGFLIGGLVVENSPSNLFSVAPRRRGALPHQIAKEPGGISLRFAMVHDVIHERFPRHGEAYYRKRNAESLQKLESLAKMGALSLADQETQSEATDDLAVGFVHLKEFDNAIKLLREKLAAARVAGQSEESLYSTYANLGTAMMIASLHRPLAADSAARIQLAESIELIRKAIAINPNSHFGREIWQARLGEFLLRAADDPRLITQRDMIGHLFSTQPPQPRRGEHPASTSLSARDALRIARAIDAGGIDSEARDYFRSLIHTVAPEPLSPSGARLAAGDFVPFDEPTLGIIGMWRYGGGANPHFAVCLGEIMLRVGQRYIAWSAYERAIRLAEGVWPDLQIRNQFIERCRARQGEIEPMLTDVAHKQLVAAFEKELAIGETYQQEYQRFEAAQLMSGVALADPHFYDAFERSHPPIASAPGDADEVEIVAGRGRIIPISDGFVSMGVLVGGLFSLAAAILICRSRNAGRIRIISE